MGSVAELKDAVREALRHKGVLPSLQASVRSQIFNVLLDSEDCPRPEPPCDETLLINELIREYLCWHGLRDSLSVFIPETGQPAVRPFDREFMAKKLRVKDTPQAQQVPLLYHLVARQQKAAALPSPRQQLGGAGSSNQQQQQLAGVSAAGRLPGPEQPQQQQQQLVPLKAVDAELPQLHSISTMSDSTAAE